MLINSPVFFALVMLSPLVLSLAAYAFRSIPKVAAVITTYAFLMLLVVCLTLLNPYQAVFWNSVFTYPGLLWVPTSIFANIITMNIVSFNQDDDPVGDIFYYLIVFILTSFVTALCIMLFQGLSYLILSAFNSIVSIP